MSSALLVEILVRSLLLFAFRGYGAINDAMSAQNRTPPPRRKSKKLAAAARGHDDFGQVGEPESPKNIAHAAPWMSLDVRVHYCISACCDVCRPDVAYPSFLAVGQSPDLHVAQEDNKAPHGENAEKGSTKVGLETEIGDDQKMFSSVDLVVN